MQTIAVEAKFIKVVDVITESESAEIERVSTAVEKECPTATISTTLNEDLNSSAALSCTEHFEENKGRKSPHISPVRPTSISATYDLTPSKQEDCFENSSTSFIRTANEMKELFRRPIGNVRMQLMKVAEPDEPYRRVSFSTTHPVYMIQCTTQRHYPKIMRVRYDPWRKYGVLRKLHEIGGWAFRPKPINNRLSLRFYEIKKGSKPPSAPKGISRLYIRFRIRIPLLTASKMRTLNCRVNDASSATTESADRLLPQTARAKQISHRQAMMGPKNSTPSTANAPKGGSGSTPENNSTHTPVSKNSTQKDDVKNITDKHSPIKRSLQTDEKKQSRTNSTSIQTREDMNAFDDLSPPDLEGSSEESSDSNRTNEEMKALFRGNFGRVRTQQLIIPKPDEPYKRVSFSKTHTMYILPRTRQRLHQRIVRSRHDAWRKYGVLKKLHEVGGWAYPQQPIANKSSRQFYEVKKGTQPPPPPKIPPILTIEDFTSRPPRIALTNLNELAKSSSKTPSSPNKSSKQPIDKKH
uniref:Uncharacterized protein n=1 Tax=Ascaris lumbricoides TaxID=6252 RepID=A0A9J2PTF8_ASCLU